MNRTLTGALLLAATFFTQLAAHAGELTLYTDDDFQGRAVTLHESAANFVELGFNDRASSVVVRSGRWEVCADANFNGTCVVFGPGEYPSLQGFNDKVSSAREVGHGGGNWRDRDRDRDRDRGHGHGRRGMLELFTQPGLRGNSTHIVGDTDDFGPMGFNNRTYSLNVESGTWQLCSETEYRGVCRLFEPGRYPQVGRELSGRVSSARLVDGGGGGWRPPAEETAPVMLFSGDGMRGRMVPLRRDARNFEAIDFNDRTGSIIVNEGQWEFCMHADFDGRCVVFGPGRYDRLGGMNNQISSARRLR
ncbi:beta/gamma crystallin-related protein [Janthinobacterium fluminis]|uniref:Beta/gamma crystallin-related protein n=1 Tax=Janthinobacterium fluminis TaxID=2987524 RepID=A0ABT5JZ30_9BURK|nr:beta/gamma crystallin-related protein [Janthinobacterium fluminis]MDC8757450.1 beta/gamma crystallin-related protein [Janthinobacterium fluminis]